mgnify:FL=1
MVLLHICIINHIGNCVAACAGPFQDQWGCYETFGESEGKGG